MNYFEILKKSFLLPWKHKFLIGLGILASFAVGGAKGNFNFSIPGSGDFDKYFQDSEEKVGRVLGEATSNFGEFVANNAYWIALVVLIVFLFFLVLWILGIIANAGLIRSVIKLEKNEKSSFGDGMREGKRFFWRSVGYFLLIFVAVLILLAVLGGVAVPLFIFVPILGFIWAALAILVFIIAVIYIGIVAQFWLRLIVIEDKRVISTIKEAVTFVNSRFKNVIVFWLITLVIGIVYGVVVLLVMAILAIPFVLLAIGLGIVGGIALGVVIGVIGALVIIAASLLLSGYYNAVISAYWTFAYLELTKRKF